jgi:hypothetical protein
MVTTATKKLGREIIGIYSKKVITKMSDADEPDIPYSMPRLAWILGINL